MDGKKVGIGIGIVVLVAIVVGAIFLFFPKDKEDVIYKVTFDNDGVTEVVEVREFGTVGRPIDPEKEGYIFDGWYYDGTKFDFTRGITKDITLVARWLKEDAKKWVITFDSAGGMYIESLNVIDGEKIEQIPTPEKDGYKFIGWYYNDEEFDFETEITKDILLVAKWEKVSVPQTPVKKTYYTVKFNTDGGNKIDDQTVEKNGMVSRPNDPKKDGYVFIGWYNGDSEFNFTTKVTKDITLVAKWKKIETPVGPETPSEPDEPEDPVEPDTPDKPETPSEPEKEDVYYTVTFNTNGGSNIASEKVLEGKTVSMPNDPTLEGYTFVGWYYNDAQFNFNTLITSDITLIAKWQKNTVITYSIENIAESYVGQVRIFVLKDGVKVDGIVNITTTNGKVVTKDIPATGYVTNGAIIKSVDNVKVK